jgi:hypothetical protein
MDLIALTALLTDTLNLCRREKYAQKFSTRSTISNHHKNGLSINFAGALDSDS